MACDKSLQNLVEIVRAGDANVCVFFSVLCLCFPKGEQGSIKVILEFNNMLKINIIIKQRQELSKQGIDKSLPI